ncbi:MAG: hypothetical protein K2J85_07385, partial [Anaeroplasmataceae bacterium]|nr:hypothetical protein [Anaeroplasmataceae bacterium]
TYISGYGFSYPRLALEVETKSIISFQFEAEWDLSTGAAVVKDLEGNVITSTQYNTFELEPGKYIVEVYSNDHILCMCHIKYTALEIEDMEVNVSLKESSLSQISSPDFPSETSKSVGRTQVVKYTFELKEDSLIAYSDEIQIFKKDGSSIFDFDDNNYYHPYKLLYLSQGQYYFISMYPYGSYYGNDTRSYKIGVVRDQLDTVFNLDQMTELVIGQELFLKKDWEYDMEYLVLHILEDGEYQFNQNLNVYDENFEYYSSTSSHWPTQFTAGTYYLKYNYAYSHHDEISILVKLVTDEISLS